MQGVSAAARRVITSPWSLRPSGFAGLSDQKHGVGPRIHDLRHTFAVQTMIDWYREGLDPNKEMIKLTTILGHESASHTYWYIKAIPELLELASRRAELSLRREARQ
ncbi:hypothetical protein AS026_15980 [Rhizobium altiplani]|nr:hypothetical protein AS026_15980 [Rhizobium altiplani]